jgi:hypothetical protein
MSASGTVQSGSDPSRDRSLGAAGVVAATLITTIRNPEKETALIRTTDDWAEVVRTENVVVINDDDQVFGGVRNPT